MMKSYNQILEELFVRFPSVQNVGFAESAYKPGLERMEMFDNLLGRPSQSLRTIHVAGTNGKGSVSSFLASALSAEGYTVGLFTSPHILDFRERMRIVEDGLCRLVPEDYVVSFVEKWQAEMDRLSLSFFEITTGMAFDWFASEQVDIAVIEVGLGGRLDSTNIIIPELSVITSIGLDHCAQLGSTREAIAREKAGIFKSGVPALVGIWDEETAPVFEDVASDIHCPLFFADEWEDAPEELLSSLDLRGAYQDVNVRTVLAALDILGIDASWEAIAGTAAITGFHGRWETLRTEPLVICDIGHNPPALKLNFAQLEDMLSSGKYDKLLIVYGVMADKALDDIIPLMPADAQWYFATASTPRAMRSDAIAGHFLSARPGDVERVKICSTVAEALSSALADASIDSLIYIGGSTFVVADAVNFFKP